MSGKGRGTVRIIGGNWRGRRVPVADVPGLRPSGDRGREVLFNWLQAQVRGASCVDLFAGTGALGLEAASRGARQVTLVEKSRVAARQLRENVARLEATHCRVVCADALDWLASGQCPTADLVFVDPPFDSDLQGPVLELLAAPGCLAEDGLVYVECAKLAPPTLSAADWRVMREKELGDVRMLLLKKTAAD
jgi:16S rRNA (guanine966-N2)-methyltransferase